MDPREMETLVQRLVQNPHDQDTITYAHQAGQRDPKSYAMLLEKVGTATSDPAFACHWLTESANVWTTTLGDAHRAARALMIAIDRDPTQPTPAERLAELYREKGDSKALVALLERRAKALAAVAQQDVALRPQVAGLHEELGQLWSAPPLSQPKKAIEAFKRAVEFDETSQFSIYSVRELLKAESRFEEAVPYFELEQRLVTDAERQIALYHGEQAGRVMEAATKAAAYLKQNPTGAMAAEARKLVSIAAEEGGDDALIDALAPAPGADVSDQVQGLVEQAQALVRKAKKNEAAAKYREVLGVDRSNEDAIAFLEPYLRQTRKFQELRDVLLAAARDANADEERRKGYFREVAGLCETQLRDAETATSALKELLSLDATDDGARSQLKRLLQKAQQRDDLAAAMAQ